MATEEYKERYGEVFKKDFRFSKEYSTDANKRLLEELSTIIDYETVIDGQPHPLDLQGYDRRINISFSFGIRIRDTGKAGYAEFTVDHKELNHNITDPHYYYFFAYAQRFRHKVDFNMIFDYRRLKKLYSEGKIKPTDNSQAKHSAVNFLGFKIIDLYKNGLILAYEGEPSLIEELGLPKQAHYRIDRSEVKKD